MNYPTAEEVIKAKENKEIKESVIERALGLVYKWALYYYHRSYWMDLDDLISEGVVGLIHAIKCFDPQKGTQFSTIASYHIRSWMLRFIKQEKEWREIQSIHWENDDGQNIEDRIKMEELFQFDDYVKDYDYEVAKELVKELDIPDRMKKILIRKLEGYTYADIGRELGLTKERVRQIFQSAIIKIQRGEKNGKKCKTKGHLEGNI